MRIGIYGGSFNPVHNGHIHLALTVANEFNLKKIYLVPSGISSHRSSSEYASNEDRFEMLRLASISYENLELCDYELRRADISYTIFTVLEFRRRFPYDELFLLVGSDMLMCFDSWNRFEDILGEVTLLVVSRENGDFDILETKANSLRKFGKVIVSRATPIEISSTEIRNKIAKNKIFSFYLNKNVVKYVRFKKLYIDQ